MITKPEMPTPVADALANGRPLDDDTVINAIAALERRLSAFETSMREFSWHLDALTPDAEPLPRVEAEKTGLYACEKCGRRTKAQGGITWAVCDACWAKTHPVEMGKCATCGGTGLRGFGVPGVGPCPDCKAQPQGAGEAGYYTTCFVTEDGCIRLEASLYWPEESLAMLRLERTAAETDAAELRAELDAARAENARLLACVRELHAWADSYVHPKTGMGSGIYMQPMLSQSAARELLKLTGAALLGGREP